MKEVRPSTWITLIVLALLIFVPAFFVDVDSLQPPANGGALDNTIRPVNPLGNPDERPVNKPKDPPANEPAPDDDSALD